MTDVPRSVQDILDNADELSKRFEEYEPRPEDRRDPAALLQLQKAAESRADVERAIVDAVRVAREANYSWRLIGSLLGTSGEAARQRYGHRRAA